MLAASTSQRSPLTCRALCVIYDTGAPRRLDFLNLHLCLTREGYLESNRGGIAIASYPYCFAPPTYVQYLGGQWPRESVADDQNDDVADNIWGDGDGGDTGNGGGADAAADGGEHTPWDHGIRLWRLLLARGGVQDGLLTLDALTEALFELADAHVLKAQMPVRCSPFVSSRRQLARARSLPPSRPQQRRCSLAARRHQRLVRRGSSSCRSTSTSSKRSSGPCASSRSPRTMRRHPQRPQRRLLAGAPQRQETPARRARRHQPKRRRITPRQLACAREV